MNNKNKLFIILNTLLLLSGCSRDNHEALKGLVINICMDTSNESKKMGICKCLADEIVDGKSEQDTVVLFDEQSVSKLLLWNKDKIPECAIKLK